MGGCAANLDMLEDYRHYADHIRKIAEDMTSSQLEARIEFHLLAWRVLRAEFQRR